MLLIRVCGFPAGAPVFSCRFCGLCRVFAYLDLSVIFYTLHTVFHQYTRLYLLVFCIVCKEGSLGPSSSATRSVCRK